MANGMGRLLDRIRRGELPALVPPSVALGQAGRSQEGRPLGQKVVVILISGKCVDDTANHMQHSSNT
jgi:hypothetical protein